MSKNTISDRGRSRCTAVARSGDHDAGLIFRLETEPASQVLKQAVVFFRGGVHLVLCRNRGGGHHRQEQSQNNTEPDEMFHHAPSCPETRDMPHHPTTSSPAH